MNVVIIEDEESAAFRLRKQLEEIEPSSTVVATLESIEDAYAWFSSNPAPDLIFADIQLADGISFTLFDKIEVSCPVIFVTAYDDFAIKAFKLNSIDYLLKPLKKAELESSLEKFKKLHSPSVDLKGLNTLIQHIKGGMPSYQKRLIVRFAQTIQVIEISSCAYFYTEEKITFTKLKDAKEYSVDHTLDELEQLLDPTQFFRLNRQVIANIHAIRKMEAYSKSRVKVFMDPEEPYEIIVSSERSPAFKEWLLG